MYNRATLLNAFTPSREVVEPELFAGRQKQILELCDALQTAGQIPVIYGDRGLGKTSLAVQAQLIAMGATELLDSIKASDRSIPESEAFLALYVACSDEVRTGADLIQLLINSLEDLDVENTDSDRPSRLVDRKTSMGVTLKLFRLESVRTYQAQAERIRFENLNLSEKLQKVVRAIGDSTEQRKILFIIDEIDRAESLSGFASFLHNVSSPVLRFMLIGVAQNIADLHLSHPSVDRALVPISVPRMTRGELADVIDRAVSALHRSGLPHRFAPEARKKLVEIAGGFPWFIHVIGQQALISAADSGQEIVSKDHITRAIRNLTERRFAQQFADAYHQAVRDSAQREKVLRVFASWASSQIPTREVYPILKRLGVRNPAVYKGHLTSADYGEVIIRTGNSKSGIMQFRNEMFKQYAYLRPSIFAGVDGEVESAMRPNGA